MSSFNYIAILGRQPELGLVELESTLGAENVQSFGTQAALVSGQINIARYGGVLKFAEIIYHGEATAIRELPIDVDSLPLSGSKTSFGLSGYGLRETPQGFLAVGLTLKKQLRERGSVRLVSPVKGLALSAAELHHNHVIEQGFELLVVAAGRSMVLARTLAVQDIDWYSRRDYDRPARDARVGMLPPKLAQVLVNSVAAQSVYDPFCGTGVVLQEALLMGRTAAGSDLAPEMVQATQLNLEWLDGESTAALPAHGVTEDDARTIKLPAGAAVVSEGYLGPNQSRVLNAAEVAKLRPELLDLYRAALKNFAAQLPSGGEVSICAPAWRVGNAWEYLGIVDELPKLGYTLKGFKHVRTPLLYARGDTIVGRQLLLLRKN